MDLSILIVTYNSAGLIGKLLDQLQVEIWNEGQLLPVEVVLVEGRHRSPPLHRWISRRRSRPRWPCT